jgi:serine/threonine protein kinase
MTLAAGTHLSSYEIAGLIGAGGMGEVYRARDLRLGRDVAIKVLPDMSRAIPNGSAVSSAKRSCSPRSIIRTSRPSTGCRNPATRIA